MLTYADVLLLRALVFGGHVGLSVGGEESEEREEPGAQLTHQLTEKRVRAAETQVLNTLAGGDCGGADQDSRCVLNVKDFLVQVQILTQRWRCCWQWQEGQERLEACDGARRSTSSCYLASPRSSLGVLVLVSVFPGFPNTHIHTHTHYTHTRARAHTHTHTHSHGCKVN